MIIVLIIVIILAPFIRALLLIGGAKAYVSYKEKQELDQRVQELLNTPEYQKMIQENHKLIQENREQNKKESDEKYGKSSHIMLIIAVLVVIIVFCEMAKHS